MNASKDKQISKPKHSNDKKFVFKVFQKEKSIIQPVMEEASPSRDQTFHASTSQASSSSSTSKKSSPKTQTAIVFVERRSCFYCGCRGHLVRDCLFLSKQKLKKAGKKTKENVSQTSVLKNKSASSKVVQKAVKDVKTLTRNPVHNLKLKQTVEPQKVWRKKVLSKEVLPHGNDPSIKSNDFKKNSKLIDVIIVDDAGRPNSVKAWVTLSN